MIKFDLSIALVRGLSILRGKINVFGLSLLCFMTLVPAYAGEVQRSAVDKEVVQYCHVLGCDNYLFYNYYTKNNNRFCHEKRVVSNNGRAMSTLRTLAHEVQRHGLPEHVSLIALMESSLNPRASAGNGSNSAKGIWQIQTATALDLGLSVHPIDERFDVKKSTAAASDYIHWLSDRLDGNLTLSILAYHAGIGRVERLSKKTGTNNPWYLSSLISDHEPDKDYLYKFFSYTLSFMGVGCGG